MDSNLSERLDLFVCEVKGTLRYRWTTIFVTWVIAVIGWLGSYAIANTYEASARLFVDGSTALRPLLQGLTIDSGVQSQLDLVRRGLLSKPQLEKVARETGLLVRATTPAEQEFLISRLSEDITITSDVSRSGDNLYTMAYVDIDRDKSIEVVTWLLNSFMEDVVGSKREGQESAQRFLREQIAEYERRLSDAETRLANFKKENLGMVPGERGDYFTRLQGEQDELERAKSAQRLALRRQRQLEQQLSGEVPFIADPSRDNVQNGGTIAQLREAESRLQELLLRFTEKHPEVVALRESIDRLNARYDREIEMLRSGVDADGSSIPRSSNLVYQRIQVALNEVEVELAEQLGEISDRERRIRDLQGLLDTAPEVEAEFARLNRDYGVTRAQYDSFVQRLETARISELADRTGVVKFEVIDPPSAATIPVGPNRGLLVTASLIFGLAAGVGIAYAKNFGNPVYFDEKRLALETGQPVIGAIGLAFPGKQLEVESADNRLVVLALGSLTVAYLIALIWADKFSAILQQVLTAS